MRSILLGSCLAAVLVAPALAQTNAPDGGPGAGTPGYSDQQAPGGSNPAPAGGGRGAGRLQQRFAQANITHDGRLTLAQARAGHMLNIAHHFDQIDTAHQGFITLDQLRAYRRRMLAQRRAAQGEPGPGPGSPPPQ
jgi:glutathione S-transferase